MLEVLRLINCDYFTPCGIEGRRSAQARRGARGGELSKGEKRDNRVAEAAAVEGV
jgi:hypothetical protein